MKYIRVDWKPKRINADFTESSIFSYVEKLKKKINTYKLFYSSKDSKWTRPGTLAAKLINHGNGLTFSYGKQTIELDYSADHYPALLLSLDKKNCHGICYITEYEDKK